MKNLQEYSTEELILELQRRDEEEMPKLVDNPDYTKLKETCLEYIKSIQKEGYSPDKQYIFEAAMEVLFGENVWDWINDNTD